MGHLYHGYVSHNQRVYVTYMGVSENREHPIAPNGFADQTIPF